MKLPAEPAFTRNMSPLPESAGKQAHLMMKYIVNCRQSAADNYPELQAILHKNQTVLIGNNHEIAPYCIKSVYIVKNKLVE